MNENAGTKEARCSVYCPDLAQWFSIGEADPLAEILRGRDTSERGFSWPYGTTGRSRLGRSRRPTTTRPPKDSTGENKPETAQAAQLNANSPATGEVPPVR